LQQFIKETHAVATFY